MNRWPVQESAGLASDPSESRRIDPGFRDADNAHVRISSAVLWIDEVTPDRALALLERVHHAGRCALQNVRRPW